MDMFQGAGIMCDLKDFNGFFNGILILVFYAALKSGQEGKSLVVKLLIAGAIAIAARRTSDNPLASKRISTVCKRGPDLAMRDAPIEPSWILEGSPVARAAEHVRSADDSSFSALWDCTAGTFRWYFHWDETVVILEGEVHITDEDGNSYTLRAGDMGYFAARSWATWRIDDYVKKAAFIRRPFPSPIAALYRLKNSLSQQQPTF